MLVTNQTAQDYWFGPLHLLGGVGQTLTVDDTTATSLYLTEDAVADAINNLYISGKITVSSAAAPFPRPTGVPQLLHGDGAPEGLVFAPQGSVYMRRDGTGANSLYTKTTGVTLSTGWQNYTTVINSPGTTYRKNTAKAVNTSTTETDLLNGEIVISAGVLSATGILRITAWGDYLNNSGAGTASQRFKLKLGTTVLIDTSAQTGTPQPGSTTRYGWKLLAEIIDQNATNVQWIRFRVEMERGVANDGGVTAFTTGSGWITGSTSPGNSGGHAVFAGYNTAAVDMTVAQALAFTVINPSASASYETKLSGALVEII